MSSCRATNANLHKAFDDDVIILARSKKPKHPSDPWDKNDWWFFWFDCDVSDCQIGRFTTQDSEEILFKDFDEYLKNVSDDYKKYGGEGGKDVGELFEIDPKLLQGWLSF